MLGDIIVRVPSAPSVFPTKEENDARRPDWLPWVVTLTLKALKYFVQTMKTKGFFEFEIIINVLVNSFWFIWIPVLWVCGRYIFFFTLTVRGSTLDVDWKWIHLQTTYCSLLVCTEQTNKYHFAAAFTTSTWFCPLFSAERTWRLTSTDVRFWRLKSIPAL